MAEPEKLPETIEEVRRRKNHESSWSSNYLVAEDLDGWIHFRLFISVVQFFSQDTFQYRSFDYRNIFFVLNKFLDLKNTSVFST